jgi:hypothetical protein
MIMHLPRFTNSWTSPAVILAAFLLMTTACGDEGNLVNPDDRLCNGETGVGLLIEGRASPWS